MRLPISAIERFVLDDGWFGSRRDDTKGLGDWWVAENVYPDGLTPLISHVIGLGMEFGIWVEPEMVNPDSDVFRAHPDWALISDGYEPVLGRQQLVLDLGNPDAYEFIELHLDALLRDHDISFVKWDMNRDHIQGSGRDGAAGTHVQTLRALPAARRSPRQAPRRRVRVVLPAAARASITRSCGARSVCGRATATMRSNARRSSAAPRC